MVLFPTASSTYVCTYTCTCLQCCNSTNTDMFMTPMNVLLVVGLQHFKMTMYVHVCSSSGRTCRQYKRFITKDPSIIQISRFQWNIQSCTCTWSRPRDIVQVHVLVYGHVIYVPCHVHVATYFHQTHLPVWDCVWEGCLSLRFLLETHWNGQEGSDWTSVRSVAEKVLFIAGCIFVHVNTCKRTYKTWYEATWHWMNTNGPGPAKKAGFNYTSTCTCTSEVVFRENPILRWKKRR